MARQIVFFALIFIISMTSAVIATVPAAGPAASPALDDDSVGTLDGADDAAPVGGPVPDGTFTATPAISDSSDATATVTGIKISSMAAAAAAVVLFTSVAF